MSPRNPDGRFRNLNQPTVLSSEMMEVLREADRLDLDLKPGGDADDPCLP